MSGFPAITATTAADTSVRRAAAPVGFRHTGSATAEAGISSTDTGGNTSIHWVIWRFGDRAGDRAIAKLTDRPPPVSQLSAERNAGNLSKDDLIDMQGTVVAVHSGGLYRVQCDAGHEVLAQLSGRMRRFRIKVVPGDRVTVGVSPYDPVRGIITFRAR
jgi:translation initiation factor IF-1